jgi:hypothetical protein
LANLALFELAGPSALHEHKPESTSIPIAVAPEPAGSATTAPKQGSELGLNYNIQIHLPATKDLEVYNAIFKSLREHLIG